MKSDEYFPERFRNCRKQVSKAIKIFSDAEFDKYVEPYHELREFLMQPVPEWQEGSTLPRWLADKQPELPNTEERGIDTPEFKAWSEWIAETKKFLVIHPRLEEETATTKSLILFYRNGRNIFSLSPFLIAMLHNTDVGNVRYQDVKLPYDSIYLHFGSTTDIELPIDSLEHKHDIPYKLRDKNKHYCLDGAFIHKPRDFSFDIELTFRDQSDNFFQKVPITKDFRFPTVQFSLDFNEWDTDKNSFKIKEGVTFDDSIVCFSDIWDHEINPGEIKFSEMHSLLKNPEEFKYEAEYEEYKLFSESLSLIINSLCYLNYVEDYVAMSSTNPQATELLQSLNKATKKREKQKITEKLNRIDFSKIHLFGSKIESEYSITESGIELESHWRRGHWRNQAFGTDLQEHKLIWIKPTIVRKDRGNPRKGHVYEV